MVQMLVPLVLVLLLLLLLFPMLFDRFSTIDDSCSILRPIYDENVGPLQLLLC